LLQFKYNNYVHIYNHMFNLSYLFKIIHMDKYDCPNIVLTNKIDYEYDLKQNAAIYINGIKNKLKLSTCANINYDINLNDADDLLYNYLKYEFERHIFKFKNIYHTSNIIKTEANINIIIPVKNRTENLTCLIKNFKSIIKKKNYNIMITVIEYGDNMHMKLCENELINYVSINYEGHAFNKSLMGNFVYSLYESLDVKYNYILFHDVDCIVKDNFFEEIFNLDYNNKFIQPYYNKRVLMTTNFFANKIREGITNIDDINENTDGIIIPGIGSPGGSIFMKKEMFENVGGLDYYYFDNYGPEDAMFFSKLLIYYQVHFSSSQNSEIIHLWHESNASNNKLFKSINYDLFLMMSNKNKKKLVDLFKNELINNIL
jgi:hypothetical protein